MFDRVKELSDRKGISLTELARKMDWADKAIYNWKNSSPSIDKVEKVADYFNVSTDYLLGRTDEPYWTLNDKDEADIERELERMIEDLDSGVRYSKDMAVYSDETKELLIASLEQAVRIAKMEAKRKFTPKKYRGGE